MKKTYSKPEVVFESFSLSVSIATCKNEASFNPDLGKWGCKAYYDSEFGQVLFVSEYNGCEFVEQDGNWNGICYDVPVQSLNLFGS